MELGVTIKDRHDHPVSGLKATDFEILMDAALRAKIVINALNSTGLSTNRSQGMQSMVLGELMSNSSIATGGQYIEKNNDLSAAFPNPPPIPTC